MKSLRLERITKQFGSLKANDEISIDIRQGSVHAIVGENGAGKSTLMNILYGLYQPDSGTIYIDATAADISSPVDAISQGIGMVHQHFKLVSCFTVAENIVLGNEVREHLIVLKQKEAKKEVQRLSDLYNLHVDAGKVVRDISVGMQQRAEILKCLYRKADILILDEPTAVLTPQEIDDLLRVVNELRKNGKTIIFISHKLKEVKQIADYVTVIRHGKAVGEGPIDMMSIDRMAELMVGRTLKPLEVRRSAGDAEVLLELRDVCAKKKDHEVLKQVSFTVRRGTIFGIAGVDGNGQGELVDAVLGALPCDSGSIYLHGEDITSRSIKDRRELGISHIPEDRHKHGLILDFTLKENLILGMHRRKQFSAWGLIRQREAETVSLRLLEGFDIRPRDVTISARSMSGGNQQKAIIAREVFSSPELIIAVQPTRGLDIGAMRFVREELIQLRDSGKAVLLISLDLDEILLLSDRIAVLSHGRIAGEADPDMITRQQLGIMMGGITGEEDEAI